MVKLARQTREIYQLLKCKYHIDLPELTDHTENVGQPENMFEQMTHIHQAIMNQDIIKYKRPADKRECLYCQQTDHSSNKCNTQRCFGCLEPGHFVSACPHNNNKPRFVCYACFQPGHFARDCTAVKVPAYGTPRDTLHPPVPTTVEEKPTPRDTPHPPVPTAVEEKPTPLITPAAPKKKKERKIKSAELKLKKKRKLDFDE